MNQIDWIPVQKTPKNGVIYVVCGREGGSNRPFWSRGFYLGEHTHEVDAGVLASEGRDNFSYSPFHDAWFWPEGWYEYCDFDGTSYPMASWPMFYAEVELPVEVMLSSLIAR